MPKKIYIVDLTEDERIIHGRRDEVCRDDDRRRLVESIDPGVVARLESDEQIRVRSVRYSCQQIGQSDRTDLCRSAAGLGQAGQGLLAKQRHWILPGLRLMDDTADGRLHQGAARLG